MISSLHSSLSGIHAASDIMAVSAHNVANVNTDEFKSQTAMAEEVEWGSVQVTIGRNESPGGSYDRGDGTLAEFSNVDIPREVVGQISARHLFSANIQTLKTADEMIGSLLDILA